MRSRRRQAEIWAIMADALFGMVGMVMLVLMSFLLDARKAKAVENKLENELEDVEAEFAKVLEGQSIDIVFVEDTSASMAERHANLIHTTEMIGELLPRIAPQCRIGAIGFRDTVVNRFSLTPINEHSVDQGRSLDSLRSFLHGLGPVGSHVNVETAIEAGMAMFPPDPSGTRRQVLILLGDMGCTELHTPDSHDADDVAAEERLYALVKSWTQAHAERRFVSLYAGEPSDTDSRSFFQELARSSNEGLYSENPAELVKVVLDAALAGERGQ